MLATVASCKRNRPCCALPGAAGSINIAQATIIPINRCTGSSTVMLRNQKKTADGMTLSSKKPDFGRSLWQVVIRYRRFLVSERVPRFHSARELGVGLKAKCRHAPGMSAHREIADVICSL